MKDWKRTNITYNVKYLDLDLAKVLLISTRKVFKIIQQTNKVNPTELPVMEIQRQSQTYDG